MFEIAIVNNDSDPNRLGIKDLAQNLLAPNNAQAHSNLGSALNGQRKFPEAIVSARKAIALAPEVDTVYTEPFHISKAIATLDYASKGRAGVRVRVSPHHNEHFGRRTAEPVRREPCPGDARRVGDDGDRNRRDDDRAADPDAPLGEIGEHD